MAHQGRSLERNESMKANVLIVGAGLAGSTLGLMLRMGGVDVLTVELYDARDKDKLCAGVVDPTSIRLFDRVYGTGAFDGLSPYAASKAVSRCFDCSYSSSVPFKSLPRKRLDDYCLQRYIDEGGRLIDRVSLVSIDEKGHVATFKDLRSGGRFEVSYLTLVGADGASSAVRRILTGRKQRICPAVQATVPSFGPDFIFEYRPSDVGYCWYLPHSEGATVGCMLHGATGQQCRDRLAEFCTDLSIEVTALRGAPIPEGDDMLLHAGEDAWLVGDAAGLIDAYGGGGIMHALRSSIALADALAGGEPYEAAMEETTTQLENANASLSSKYLNACFLIAAKAKAQVNS